MLLVGRAIQRIQFVTDPEKARPDSRGIPFAIVQGKRNEKNTPPFARKSRISPSA